jgi:hypothetical protein
MSYIAEMQEKLDDLPAEKVMSISKTTVITFEDHFQFQQLQASFHASGMLTPDAAQVVYIALGENFTETNGGWGKGTKLATKIAVMKLMEELLNVRVIQARKAARTN